MSALPHPARLTEPPPLPVTAATLPVVPARPWEWHEAYQAAGAMPVRGYALIRACVDAAQAAEARGEAVLAHNLLFFASGATHQHHETLAASPAG